MALAYGHISGYQTWDHVQRSLSRGLFWNRQKHCFWKRPPWSKNIGFGCLKTVWWGSYHQTSRTRVVLTVPRPSTYHHKPRDQSRHLKQSKSMIWHCLRSSKWSKSRKWSKTPKPLNVVKPWYHGFDDGQQKPIWWFKKGYGNDSWQHPSNHQNDPKSEDLRGLFTDMMCEDHIAKRQNGHFDHFDTSILGVQNSHE